MLHLLISINNKQMTQFKLPTNHRVFLEEEIYVKLLATAEQKAEDLNKMWAKREQEGRTYDTHKVYKAMYNKVVEEKIYYYKFSEFLNISFQHDRYGENYYRPISCTVNLEACRQNAIAQRDHSVALFESRINSHVATTDILHELQGTLKLSATGNLIEGYIDGTTAKSERFRIVTHMMWNYRYGENSANGYLTQYVQFRSDRQGAKQEGKSVQQAITDAEKQAKRDAKQAIIDQKNLAKWEKFQKLPVQMEKWIDKEIKRLAKIISPEGLALIQATADHMGYEFDREWKIKSISKDIELHNTLRNDLRHWQNDETGLKALFDKGIDTRNKLKEMYGV